MSAMRSSQNVSAGRTPARRGDLSRWRGTRTGLAVLGLVLAAEAAVAADRETSPLRLTNVLSAARLANPEIRAAEARYQAMQQRPIQEATLPDPSIAIRYHNEEFDRITFGESDFSFLELAAEQDIPFPGKLRLRSEMAMREADRERAMRDMTTLMIFAKVTSAYTDLAVIDRSAAMVREAGKSLALVSRQSAESYAVGVAAQQDVLRATLEQGGIEERLTMLDQKRKTALAQLASLVGSSSENLSGETTWDESALVLEPLQVLETRITASPALAAAREDVRKRDSAIELAQREYFPDFTIMAAYTNKSDLLPEWEVGLRMTVPLYFWRRQGPALTEATLERSAAGQELRKTELDLASRLREFHAMAESSVALVRLYRDRLIPQADTTFRAASAAYGVGKVDFMTLLGAYNALLEYRIRLAEETGNFRRAEAEITALIGQSPLGGDIQ